MGAYFKASMHTFLANNAILINKKNCFHQNYDMFWLLVNLIDVLIILV